MRCKDAVSNIGGDWTNTTFFEAVFMGLNGCCHESPSNCSQLKLKQVFSQVPPADSLSEFINFSLLTSAPFVLILRQISTAFHGSNRRDSQTATPY